MVDRNRGPGGGGGYFPHKGVRKYAPGSRKHFPWKDTDLGRAALIVLYFLVLEYCTDDQMRKNPNCAWYVHGDTKLRIPYDVILERLVGILPEFPAFFYEKTGRWPTPHVLHFRVINMYRYNHERGEGSHLDKNVFGPEHPKNHRKLKSVLEVFDHLHTLTGKGDKFLQGHDVRYLVQNADRIALNLKDEFLL
jgi:hypothetical protein